MSFAALSARLANFVEPRGLGLALSGGAPGFWISHVPDTVRAPDVAFVAAGRVPPSPAVGFFEGRPDLAVEVLSPGDRCGRGSRQGSRLARCGVQGRLGGRSRHANRGGASPQAPSVRLAPADDLSGEDFLPGFCCEVAEIFA